MVEAVHTHPHTCIMLIRTLETSCLPVKNTTHTPTHTHWDLNGGEGRKVNVAGKGSSPVWWFAAARGWQRTAFIMQIEMTKHLPRTREFRSLHLHPLPGLVGRIAALLSRIHLFYLWWQSCLINWILNNARQKASSHNFFHLLLHVHVRECVSQHLVCFQ